MTIITQKATVAQIPFGQNLTIEGLLLDDGSFAVAVPQVCSIFQFPIKHASRDIKGILGAGFQFPKVRTTLHPKAVNCITLVEFERLIVELSAKGNLTALELNRALIGLSLTQVFSDAFGIKFEKEDRQAYLKTRLASKVTRRTLTDSISDWYDRPDTVTSCPKGVIYANCTNQIYLALWGVTAVDIRKHFSLTSAKQNTRDYFSEAALKALDFAEAKVAEVIDNDNARPHKNAVDMARVRAAKVDFKD